MATNSELSAIVGAPYGNAYVTGAATLTVGNNLLNTVAGATSYDTLSANGVSYRSMMVQLVGTPASGVIVFEGSSDNVNFIPIYGVEQAYAWTQLVYDRASYPFAGLNAGARTFRLPIEYRYVRVRISTVLASNVQCFATFSPIPSTNPSGGLPSANLTLFAALVAVNATATIVAAPGNGLRCYFCSGSISDGSSGGTLIDQWIGAVGQPGAVKFMIYSRSTSSVEGVNVIATVPIAGPLNTGIEVYLNNGAGNTYGSIQYFIAP